MIFNVVFEKAAVIETKLLETQDAKLRLAYEDDIVLVEKSIILVKHIFNKIEEASQK